MQWLVKTPLMKWFFKKLGVTMGSVSFSGAGLGKVVADPAFAGSSGKYIQSHNGALIKARSSKVSYDETRAAKLWDDSKRLVHLQASEGPILLQAHKQLADAVPLASVTLGLPGRKGISQ